MTIQSVIERITPVATDPSTPQPVRVWLKEIMVDLEDAVRGDNGGPPLDDRFQKGAAMPTGIGARADLHADVYAERLRQEKSAAEVKARELEISRSILAELSESADTGASGQHHRVQRIEKTVQNVTDWPALWAFIRENGAFEMLQKRLSDKAVKDWAAVNKALPPGVAETKIAELSFTKI